MNAPPTDAPRARLLSGPAGRTLAVLTAVNLLNYLDRFVVSALVESLRADLWLTDTKLGWLQPAFLVVYMFASPLFGVLGDRRRRAPLLAVGVAIWSVATVFSGFARGYWTLFAARAAVGIGEAAYGTISPGLIADHYGPASRGRAYAVFFAAIPIGSALGYVVGGLVDRTLGWRAAFFFAGAPGLVLALLCLRRRPIRPAAAPSGPGQSRERRGSPATYRRLLSNRPYALTVLGYAAYTFAVGGMAFWMPAFLERTRGVPRTVATVQFGAIVVATGFLGTFAGGYLSDALRKRFEQADLWVCGISTLLAAPITLAVFTTVAAGALPRRDDLRAPAPLRLHRARERGDRRGGRPGGARERGRDLDPRDPPARGRPLPAAHRVPLRSLVARARRARRPGRGPDLGARVDVRRLARRAAGPARQERRSASS